ncbi:type IV toxin-antitoxin system AbiEi family antitoxin domain-containing protein [Leucobacter rhizosphaerae]|uniref:Type IV toxin-antitoxin system AbiEi family antitoxin domain-containing protein n=1 Tax=Leucobacter rhizosphaerae TaxID=2932245 RepID=A0ABY4FX45_9MICO|nr:DUF559 domain-containing protein [Leucobacter rhizosphaerae]UOQ60729.1 type IV toxin-antitoxin system AbiEi family antitoxin domain-containing protein [Leucobacter rhizosphaerae]
MSSLFDLLRARDGIARTSLLRDAGVTRRDIDRAFAAGAVVRPRRGWIALPAADPALLLAARQHVVLSCVTQAKRLGLWVREPSPVPHVAAPRANAHVRGVGVVVHWKRPVVPRPPFLLADGIENLLCHVAECQPSEDALVIWESALNARLVTHGHLATLPLGRAARRILDASSPFADSGLESIVHARLRWIPARIRQQVVIAGHRVDFLIGSRLVLQIDGAHHTGAQRTSDIAHDARLLQLGYTVIRVSYSQVMFAWEEVQDSVLQAMARDRHLVAAGHTLRPSHLTRSL